MRALAILLGLAAGCTGNGSSDQSQLGHFPCAQTSDCPPNPAAACVKNCSDGTNPCVLVCRASMCVDRGCPGDVDAGVPDAAQAPAHAEGDSCDDGLACAAGLVCTGVGDPCPTYPNCKRCYLPCQPGGVCPSDYRVCIPPSGQGGNVCIR
jgi:hypothetical protein